MKFYSTLTLLFLVFGTPILAQNEHWCATPDHDSEWLDKYQANPALYPKSDELLYIPLTVHITGTDSGSGYYPTRDVLNSLCGLNLDFLEANIQFYVKGEFNYINNSEWNGHTEFWQGIDMMLANNVPNTINCYLTASAAGACGYYAPAGDAVVMQRGCLGFNNNTWAHEIGHFLSLPHPFRGWEGREHNYFEPAPAFWGNREVEKVDGSNCATAGDRFCDTPADYLNFRWACNDDGLSIQTQVDPDTVSFQSDASLIMSYSRDECSSRFSPDQIAAMRANIMDARPGLLNDDPEVVDEITSLDGSILMPEEESITPFFDEVTLRWEGIPNATHYALNVSALPIFSGPKDEYIVTDTVFTLTNLDPNRKYWWRIRPYNHFGSFCTEFIDTSSFTTSIITNINEQLEETLQLAVYPNPVPTSNLLNVAFRLEERSTIQLRLYHTNGQILHQQTLSEVIGTQQTEINTANLPQGIYFLQVASEQGRISKKISIQ